MVKSDRPTRASDQCSLCGAPIPIGAPVRKPGPDHPEDAMTRTDASALVGAIDRYIALWRKATRRSAEWRTRADALDRLGYIANPVHLTVRCDGIDIPTPNGELDYLARHFDARLAAASDATARAVVAQERDAACDRAQEQYRRWRRAALDLGVLAASRRSNLAWAEVERIDLDDLCAIPQSDLPEALAMLRLLLTVGWEGVDDADAASPRRALANVISTLQQLR